MEGFIHIIQEKITYDSIPVYKFFIIFQEIVFFLTFVWSWKQSLQSEVINIKQTLLVLKLKH